MIRTYTRYLHTMTYPEGMFRTLGEVRPRREGEGTPWFTTGNSSIVFRARREDGDYLFKCYVRPCPFARERYRYALQQRLVDPPGWMEGEIYVTDEVGQGEWVDLLVTRWIEGPTLDRVVRQAAHRGDRDELLRLSRLFDRLALDMVRAEWAHGDLKPENVVVCSDGLRLIDFDALYIPELAGRETSEVGTPCYQHPARDTHCFDRHLDDYPLALISVVLRALVLDPSLYRRTEHGEGFVLQPAEVVYDGGSTLESILDRLAAEGDAAHLRMAELLRSERPELEPLEALLTWAVEGVARPAPGDVQLAPEAGLWGFRDVEGRFHIPPLYDDGFDFTEGVAAVALRGRWHYIDPLGRIARNCSDCEAIKPARNGRMRLRRAGAWEEHPVPVEER